MTKENLRKLYKQKRIDLSAAECQTLDRMLLSHLITLDWSTCQYLHVYLSIAKFNEPDTMHLVNWLRENYPNIHIVVSKADPESSVMANFLWDQNTQFQVNRWGIPEPVAGELVDEQLIDAVLVPLLVADTQGHRVGYGKGFYDRFLARCRSDVRTIGLSYFEPVERIEDVGVWDMPLKYCIYPGGIYRF
ncbi:5-formyltetrahydrofolate cyclo-ligase [Sphingobacterium sp. SGG-5]|uniref:5-formyltetrahydrofolate cyclo-ligase n=1 Tax=Sphingobacterium sp. SGG-5 TaxID=2710881 RepID=UPI0013ECFCF9|nr:5-formyltetrahydrofolate cyclo-ligase [Sphingobacterium sp. SGG-5]NGM62368.1 5-formyltetrahydrofolate cyclo-ligase [Sphingobacterium sp. SGG-5]